SYTTTPVVYVVSYCFFTSPPATLRFSLSLHDALPISASVLRRRPALPCAVPMNLPESWLRSFCNPPIPGAELAERLTMAGVEVRSEEHTSELQSQSNLVCRLLLEKKKE